MNPNSAQYHILDAIRFYIMAMIIFGLGYIFLFLPGQWLYDRWLCKKAWRARQKVGAARLEWLIKKRKMIH